VSQADLEKFRVTIYTEPGSIPLGHLVTLSNQPFDLASLRGKNVFLNLGATWCPYCDQEKDSIQRLYDTYQGNVIILTVALGETTEAVSEYMTRKGYTFPVLVDKENILRADYAPRIPTTYILNQDGLITARINGNKNWMDSESLKILQFLMNL
jgi:thiol-disulfide isomerase/thioredoxin